MSLLCHSYDHSFVTLTYPLIKSGFREKITKGVLSTLCAGRDHLVSGAIVQACFEMAIEPHRVAKMSGIGCSSKTPAYFLNNSHGFNSVHRRMPSVATGANLANRDLMYLGISGMAILPLSVWDSLYTPSVATSISRIF